MPNWCEGVLKIRGTKENLENFILHGLEPVDVLGGRKEPLKLNEYGDCHYKGTCYIENTHRGFTETVGVYLSELEDEDVICLDVQFAWGIRAKELQEICVKYHVDMRIYAFERGMEFNQEIEIVNGEIVRDFEITFDDYKWECIMPNMGG